MQKVEFALQRKTGYISRYSLGMVYPSYRKGRLYAGNTGDWVAPILVKLPLGRQRWVKAWPGVIRFPSWLARKLTDRDPNGFVKR